MPPTPKIKAEWGVFRADADATADGDGYEAGQPNRRRLVPRLGGPEPDLAEEESGVGTLVHECRNFAP